MDGHRFDDMTKALVRTTPSRRGVLRGLAGAAAALGVGVLGRTAVARSVAPADTDLICENEPFLCNREGEPAARCNRDGCRCGRTRNGDIKCVDVSDATCKNRRKCDANRDCRQGEVCVQVGGCSDCDGRGRCFERCRA